MSEKVLITGGSGLIGTRLTTLLIEKKYEVVHLGRAPRQARVPTFSWLPDEGRMDRTALEGVSAVIHLAGASIAGRRWTSGYKKEILASRVDSTRMLFGAIQAGGNRVRSFISASGIGYYRQQRTATPSKEDNNPGDDFLSTVVQKWEAEAAKISDLGPRVGMIRTGMVLSAEGGALPRMVDPVRWGVGAPLGSGEQIVSWVHIDDLCKAYIFLLENQLSGPFNVTAPQPVSNEVLTRAIARRLGKPLWLPNIPEFILRIALGGMADAVLAGNAVSSEKIVNEGFSFEFRDVDTALEDLVEI